jgi:hypothetical protein
MSSIIGKKDRISATARFIARELEAMLDRFHRNDDERQTLNKSMDEAGCYEEVTNAQRVAATLRALSMVQLKVMDDLESLTHGDDDDDEDEDDEVAA